MPIRVRLPIPLCLALLSACSTNDLQVGNQGNGSSDGGLDAATQGQEDGGAEASGTGPAQAGEPVWDEFAINANPPRVLDILFMIDNSPSMEQEQANLARGFRQMIEVLKNSPGGLPDLHIGVVDSSLGAGSLGCNGSLPGGDRGILWGNPNWGDDGSDLANVNQRPTPPATFGCGLNPGARWIEDNWSGRNYTGDITDVFACLANVGTQGCGFEHQLRAVQTALDGATLPNAGFLRPEAFLAVVLVTDEDDCSADPTDPQGMFSLSLPREAASLRCAALGHTCNGQPIPYYDVQSGFTPLDPNAPIGFQTAFGSCAPRTDAGLPLLPVQELVDRLRSLKPRPDDQIIVAGIYGWPLPGEESSALYQIGQDLDADQESAGGWSYLPVCQSAGLGKAYGGLRLKQFVDAFGGQTFSICGNDFADAMFKVGDVIAKKIIPLCEDYWLADRDHDPSNGVQALCTVLEQVPSGNPAQRFNDIVLTECSEISTLPCWRMTQEANLCPRNGQRIVVDWPTDPATGKEQLPPPGTLLDMFCAVCPDPANTTLCPHP